MVFSSCDENNSKNEVKPDETEAIVYVKDNMLVFQDYAHINSEIAKFNKLSINDKRKWLKSYGVETYGQVFRDVMEKEDSISNYYSNLPEEDQKYFLSQPQVYSELYKQTLDKGIIKVVRTSDNEYFDLNLVNKKYADFLNLNGRLVIGKDIISVSECEEKIFIDAIANLSEIDYSKLKSLTLKESNTLKSVNDNESDWSQTSSPIYYDKNFLGKNTKKVWAEIEGSSRLIPSLYSEYNDETSYWAKNLTCTFELKAYAQSRNFWGNFVFGNWSTEVIFDAEWSYWYAYQFPGSLDQITCYDDFPSYSCTPNPDYVCPTSPYYEVGMGNGYIQPLSPDGSWQKNGEAYFVRPINISTYDINIWIDGKKFEFHIHR